MDIRLLPRGGLRFAGPRRKEPGGHFRMDHHERVALEDADQARVPLHAHAPAEQRERHRIETAVDFDMAVGVHRPRAGGENRKRRRRERLEGALLRLDEMGPDLAARGSVNPQPRDGAIPVLQKGILRGQAVEASPLERIVFDVAAAALLLAVLLRVAGLRRQRREAPVRRERQVDLVTVGIVEARARRPP